MSKAIQHIDLDGADVSLKGEMVSLTGLWAAAGADPSKKPAHWRRLPTTIELCAYLIDLNMLKSDNELFAVTRGGKAPGTWAHWHIAMAYARYLDPAFAVRCNEIVRAHMEKRIAPASSFPEELVKLIERTDGVVRMLAKKVTRIEQAVIAEKSGNDFSDHQENGPAEVAPSPSHGSIKRNSK